MASKVQSNQVVNEAALAEIGSALREEADDLFVKINNRLVDLCSLSVTGSSKVVTVGPSVLQMPNLKYKAFPQLKSVDLGNLSGTMDFGTGTGTGSVQTVVLPTMTNAWYIRAGFQILSDKKIYVIFGTQAASAGAAGAPAFSKSGISLGEVLLQASGAGQGNYTNPTMASLTQMQAGGSGGGGSGSGVGGINYVDNFDAEVDTSGWATYNDYDTAPLGYPVNGTGGTSTLVLSRETTTTLRGTGSFKIVKPASSTVDQGVSYDLLVFDNVDANTSLINVSFDWNDDGNYNNTISVFLYDKTGAVLNPVNGNGILNKGKGRKTFQFYSSASSTSYRLCLHVTTTSTTGYTFYFDNVVVGPESTKESLSQTFYAAAHGFAVGDIVTNSAGVWSKADADAANNKALALVTDVVDTNNFVVLIHGYFRLHVNKATGLHYLSETTAGGTVQTADQLTITPVMIIDYTDGAGTCSGFFRPSHPRAEDQEGDLSFRPRKVVGTSAYLRGGAIRLSSGEVLVSGGGTTEATVRVPLTIDLATLVPSPTSDTTYYLYIDRQALVAGAALSDSGRKVTLVSDVTHFDLFTTAPDAINPLRYVNVGYFRYATAAWSTTLFGYTPSRYHDQLSDFFSTPEMYKRLITVAESATDPFVLTHNLSGAPQLVQLFYNVSATGARQPVDPSSHLITVTSTTISVSPAGFPWATGDTLEVEATYIPVTGNQIASMSTQFESAWYDGTISPAFIPHNLTDREDIKSFVVQEWDTTTGRRRLLPPESLVSEFDNTNLYLDWTGFTPSSTLKYRITTGGSALPQSVPYWMGGYTKFVGMGAGSYSTIAAALAASAPGDSILVGKSETITATLACSVNDIKIEWMPLVKTSVNGAVNGITLSGSRCRLINPWVEGIYAGTVPAAIEISGDDNFIEGAKVTSNLAGCTITTAYSVTAAGERNWINGIKKVTAGAITNAIVDSGTDNDYSVRG